MLIGAVGDAVVLQKKPGAIKDEVGFPSASLTKDHVAWRRGTIRLGCVEQRAGFFR